MKDKQIIIDGKECRYWFRPNPSDYRKCSLRDKNDNCDEINDCFIKELLGKLARKEQECEKYRQALDEIEQTINNFPSRGIQEIPQTQVEFTQHLLCVSEEKKKKILGIIYELRRDNNG